LTRPRSSTKKCGEDAPETADLYFAYGKALLENAISQSSVLGKDQPEDGAEEAQGAFSRFFCSLIPGN
jgi:HAT1-interacting factor 1